MAYKEIAIPNLITNIEAEEIRKIKITLNYADGSIHSTVMEEGNELCITYLYNGKLTENYVGRLKRILHTQPNMSFEFDSSKEFEAEYITIPLATIRSINNLSYPENDNVILPPSEDDNKPEQKPIEPPKEDSDDQNTSTEDKNESTLPEVPKEEPSDTNENNTQEQVPNSGKDEKSV